MKKVKKNINSFVIHTKKRQECFLLVWLKGLKSEVSRKAISGMEKQIILSS